MIKVIPSTREKCLLAQSENADDLNESALCEPVLDDTALKQCKQRLAELNEDIKQAENLGSNIELKELETERDQIITFLKSATGKNGRSRKILNQEETQRQAVKNCINDSFNIIKKGHTSLYDHFKTSKTIKLGFDCSYNPPKAISWLAI